MSLVKRRRRPEPVVEEAPVPEQVAELPGPEPDVRPAAGLPDTPEVRALRAQVKVLEQALDRVVEPPDFDSYRTQVLAAVRAVALGTPESGDPRTAVARVIAALERIDAPVGRTVLPPPVDGSAPTVAPAAPPREPEIELETEVETEVEVEVEVEAPAEAEVVLPVPPPAPAPSRPRRRRRRVAA